jgi:hypothetical protein
MVQGFVLTLRVASNPVDNACAGTRASAGSSGLQSSSTRVTISYDFQLALFFQDMSASLAKTGGV